MPRNPFWERLCNSGFCRGEIGMLQIANRLRDLSFGALMEVYREGNEENGRALAPEETPARQLALAEQDFYGYLRDTFFRTPGAQYAVWAEDGRYVSALRLEPYQDGLLLAALETVADQRGRGYASCLISAVQKLLESEGAAVLYSHVSRTNTASLRTHEKCGFVKTLDYARYLDGSINRRAVTLCWKKI